MYVREIYIENNGTIDRLHLTTGFLLNGQPKPILLVGSNGSGKTNFLSLIADVMFEVAATHFTDVVAGSSGNSRSWFRVVGGMTIKVGKPGSVSVIRLSEGSTEFAFQEKAGNLRAEEVRSRIPETLRPYTGWNDENVIKTCNVPIDVSKTIFESGAYLYSPASRSETPHWLNQNSIPAAFDLSPKYTQNLGKPIFIEKGIEKLAQWILSVLMDTRLDLSALAQSQHAQSAQSQIIGQIVPNLPVLADINRVLQTILDDVTTRIVWLGRHNRAGVGFSSAGGGQPLPLTALSAGQATLFNVFCTLMRYGDGTTQTALPTAAAIRGICVIDEIDAHMHVDLQHRALPVLIKMFPNVQFFLSCHSPLFVLGMENVFPNGDFHLIDMPSGNPVQAEAYSEFARALSVLQETQAFNEAVLEAAQSSGKILVLVEGETDPIYLNAAIESLGFNDLLDIVDISWIGAKDPKKGEGFNTGKDSLNSAFSFLRAKPELISRPICLLYDNDANKPDFTEKNLFVRSFTTNIENNIVTNGIENLLPESVITDDMFDRKENRKGNGTKTSVLSLNKMKLCEVLCKGSRIGSNFEGFRPTIEIVAAIAHKVCRYELPKDAMRDNEILGTDS